MRQRVFAAIKHRALWAATLLACLIIPLASGQEDARVRSVLKRIVTEEAQKAIAVTSDAFWQRVFRDARLSEAEQALFARLDEFLPKGYDPQRDTLLVTFIRPMLSEGGYISQEGVTLPGFQVNVITATSDAHVAIISSVRRDHEHPELISTRMAVAIEAGNWSPAQRPQVESDERIPRDTSTRGPREH